MDLSVAIVGSGFSGIGLAINLRKAGVEDFAVLERGGGVGGTWHSNTYPGCACDVPSNLYSFSFAPNPDWTRTYSRQPEIRAYLERVVDTFGVRSRIRLNTEVLEASWSDEAQRWRIDTSAGRLTAKVLVSGTGPLVEPRIPDFPGLESFAGPAMQGIAPNVVPRASLPTAIALGSVAWQGGAVLGPAMGGFLYAYGQARVHAELAGAFVNLEPVVGAAAGWLLLGESAAIGQVAGATAVLAGIAVSTLPARAPAAWGR